MLPETKPSKSRKAKRAEEALGGSGLLALCEVATATPGDASPTSTISVSPRRAPLGGTDCVTSPADHKGLGRASPPDLTMVDAAAAAPPKQKTAAFIGVRRRPWGSYAAEIRNHLTGSREWLGTFNTAEEAAVVYDLRKRQIKGEHTKCNFAALDDSGELVSREICPHGQSRPERLTLWIPANWSAQVQMHIQAQAAAASAKAGPAPTSVKAAPEVRDKSRARKPKREAQQMDTPLDRAPPSRPAIEREEKPKPRPAPPPAAAPEHVPRKSPSPEPLFGAYF